MPSGEPFIFFSLHSYILAFAVQETMVCDTLKDAGFTPLLLWPDECTCEMPATMASWHPKRPRICSTCRRNHCSWKATTPGWEHGFLPDYSSNTDLETLDNLMARLTVSTVKELTLNGVEIGKTALHD
ncbi:MAG: hypothetical protein EBS01_15880, partial [Verrucomicrobia bacterium]|nr:hypothetical protein [Verrucomicrobiota bacterium]